MSTTASHAGSHGEAHGTHYFVPEPSHWMIFGSAALLCMASGAATWFNGWLNGVMATAHRSGSRTVKIFRDLPCDEVSPEKI